MREFLEFILCTKILKFFMLNVHIHFFFVVERFYLNHQFSFTFFLVAQCPSVKTVLSALSFITHRRNCRYITNGHPVFQCIILVRWSVMVILQKMLFSLKHISRNAFWVLRFEYKTYCIWLLLPLLTYFIFLWGCI